MIKMHMPPLASVRGQTLLTDNKPYLYRQSPIASQMLDLTLTGGTVAVNQIVKKPTFESPWGSFSNATQSITSGVLTGTANGNGNSYVFLYTDDGVANHVYLASVELMLASTNASDYATGRAVINWSTGGNSAVAQPAKGTWGKVSAMLKPNATFQRLAFYPFGTATTGADEKVSVRNPYLIDLTLMFGTAIADYVYTLEQSTAGSGIAWLKSYGFFTADYYPYDAGSLLSVKTSGHKTVKNGVEHTYPLSDIELRGIPKLTAGQLYYDGDTYKSDGTVTRKYGIVDLGTLTWTQRTATPTAYYTQFVDASMALGAVTTISSKLVARPNTSNWTVVVGYGDNSVCIKDSGMAYIAIVDSTVADATALKTKLNGVYLVYELATPTSETTDAFENPQQAGTTEEYIDTRTVPMPAGHVTEYFDMIQMEKIQMHMPNNQPIKMHMPKV